MLIRSSRDVTAWELGTCRPSPASYLVGHPVIYLIVLQRILSCESGAQLIFQIITWDHSHV